DDYLKRMAAEHAGDDAALATEFATTYLRLGEMQGATPEAIASFENGRQLLERKRGRGATRPADLLVLARLRVRAGSTLMDLGRTTEAVESLLAASSLAGSLQPAIGWNAEAELVKALADWRLARLYRTQYRLQEAGEFANRAVNACEEMRQRGVNNKELYEIVDGARLVLGGVLRRQGDWGKSVEMYQKVLADIERRAAEDPSSAGLQRELARIHQIMGDIFCRTPGHAQEVKLHVRSAIAITERLAALDPWDKTAQSEWAQCLSTGAESLNNPEDSAEAVGYLRRALPIFDVLLKGEPDNSVFRLYFGLTEADLGDQLTRRNPSRESIQWMRRGMADLAKLVASDPHNTTHVVELLKVHRMMAAGLALAGQENEALAVAREAIGQARSLAGDAGSRQELLRRELPRAYVSMASACKVLGKREEAGKWYRMAMGEWDGMRSEGLLSPDTELEIRDSRKGMATVFSSARVPGR
ncbi:MAG TPA: hypothetical protein VGH38_25270, partial [Bryobacteraceae bacterium]